MLTALLGVLGLAGGGRFSSPYDSTRGVPEPIAYVIVFLGIVMIIWLAIILRKARKK